MVSQKVIDKAKDLCLVLQNSEYPYTGYPFSTLAPAINTTPSGLWQAVQYAKSQGWVELEKVKGKYVVRLPKYPDSISAPSPEETEEEKTKYTVILSETGDNKIYVIKTVREVTGLSLTESKYLVETAPHTVVEGLSKDEATALKNKLEKYGAKVEIKNEYDWTVIKPKPAKTIEHTVLKTDTLKFTLTDSTKKEYKDKPEPTKQSKPKKYVTFDESVDEWKLDRNMKLETECADFYILWVIAQDYPMSYAVVDFEQHKDKLAKQFEAYLDMAIGGEVRHSVKQTFNDKNRSLDKLENKSAAHRNIISRIRSGELTGDRYSAWSEWRKIREQFGLDALKVAADIFNKVRWNSSFGGKKWGSTALVLIDYLKGGITPTTFVDTAWSLQHNCDMIFTKVWYCNGTLKRILDSKFHGELEEVSKYASPKVKDTYNWFKNNYNSMLDKVRK